jgi:hypothetical protein
MATSPPPNSTPVYVFNASPLLLNVWVNANPNSSQPAVANIAASNYANGFTPTQASTTLYFVAETGPIAGLNQVLYFGSNQLFFGFAGNPSSGAITIDIPLGTEPMPAALFVFYEAAGGVSATTYVMTWMGKPVAGSIAPENFPG